MRMSKLVGLLLCLASLLLAALLVWGLFARNYLALALPAAAVGLTVLGFIFWAGRTMMLMEEEEPAVEVRRPQPGEDEADQGG
ncbi:MAG: hypothetical protein HY677_05110 [Chloroflexi bacterium]|nr:hypothetical protein [Chloroflexota bacterium]